MTGALIRIQLGDKLPYTKHWVAYYNWNEGMIFVFNDAVNTFDLRSCGVWHMMEDHSDNERGNPLPALHGLIFLISSKGYFNIHQLTDKLIRNTAFVAPFDTQYQM